MTVLYLISVWLHVLAAMTWVGGMAFLVFVMVPLLRMPEYRERAAELVRRSMLKFRVVGWACLGTLIVTGSYNMWVRGLRWSSFFDGSYQQNPIARALGLKLLLVAAVLVVSAVHDFYIGPRATLLWSQAPDSAGALRFRKLAGMFGRVNALLALAIVYLAVMLVRGGIS